MNAFLDAWFEKVSSSAKMLELLDRFDRLRLGCLRQNIKAKYEATMQQFMEEIEQLRQVRACVCTYVHHAYTCRPHSQFGIEHMFKGQTYFV